MQDRSHRRTLRRILTGAASASLALTVLATVPAAAAGPKDRFEPSLPFVGPEGGLEPWTPQEWEAIAAERPVTGDLGYFSRCRKAPFQGTNPYAPFAGNAIVDDTSLEYADGSVCYSPQNEQNIVINPKDPKNIVTSANEYRTGGAAAYWTKNGGSTWNDVLIDGFTGPTGGKGAFKNFTDAGDPVLAFAPDGRLYLAEMVFTRGIVPAYSGIAVASSSDGGETWGAPGMIDYQATRNVFLDKEWMTVGPDGTVYVTWTEFQLGAKGAGYKASPIHFSRSTTDGKTWSAPKPVSDSPHPYNQGSQPVVANDGTVYVAYESGSVATDYATDALVVARSTNRGTTWTNVEVARVYDDFDCYPINIDGRQTLTSEQFRLNSYPSIAYDPTNGKLAIVWADNQGSGTCGQGGTEFTGTTSNQVKLVTSTNGTTWSPVKRITTDSPDKAFPAVGANAGRIVVGYFTRAYSPSATANDRACGVMLLDSETGNAVVPPDAALADAPVCLDFAMRSSSDGFATETSETRLTTESSNPYLDFAGTFIGDYEGVAVDASGKAAVVWTDDRGNPGVTTPNQDTVVATGR